jgi:hypothetical protein
MAQSMQDLGNIYAGVIIDILHTGGVQPDAGRWNIATAETVAEQTGGQFTGNSYGDKFVDRVLTSPSPSRSRTWRRM